MFCIIQKSKLKIIQVYESTFRENFISLLRNPWHHTMRICRRYILTGTVYPKKYAHGFCCAVLCCGYTLTDLPKSIRLTSLALWQSNDCPSASKATPMNMDKYFMWIHYERLHNHNKAKRNKTVCIFLGIYCIWILFFCIIARMHTWSCNFHTLLIQCRRRF